MYKGKECCQGCGKDGTQKPRYSKDKLCEDCKKIMELGKAVTSESLVEYVRVRDWYNGLSSWGFDDNTLNKFATAVLERINNPNAPTKGELTLRANTGHSTVFYTVPKAFAEPFIEFVKILNEVVRDIKKQKEDISIQAKNAVRNEKNEIFNLGVEAGRDLLMQLNRGDITIDHFNKTVIKY